MDASITLKELKTVLQDLNKEGHDIEFFVIDEEFDNAGDMKAHFGNYDFRPCFKHKDKTTGIYAYGREPDGYAGYYRYRHEEDANEYIVKLF